MANKAAILALALGTTTGWDLHTADGQTGSRTQSFKPGRFEGGGMRHLRSRGWPAEMMAPAGGIGAVLLEDVHTHACVDAAHAYGGFPAKLAAWCKYHHIPYSDVLVGTIKKHSTGMGNADMAAMVAAMPVLGFNLADDDDDDEADALTLQGWACEQRALASPSAWLQTKRAAKPLPIPITT